MSKWGLLRGAGQGIAQAGNMLVADQFDRMKEERLEKYRQSAQQKQWERDDKTRAEDRNLAEQSELRGIAERAQGRVQDQQNLDRDFELRQEQFGINKNLVNRQLEQINQTIEITGMELSKQRDIKTVWDQIQKAEDPEELETLFDHYRRLTGTDKDDRYSLHTVPEYDDMGERVGTSMYTHNSRTNQITPHAGGNGNQPEDRAAALLNALGLSQDGETSEPVPGAASDPARQQPPVDPYSMRSVTEQRPTAGGLLRRLTETRPEEEIERLEQTIPYLLRTADQLDPMGSDRQLDAHRQRLINIINSGTSEEIKQRARALFDQIR